MILLVACTFKFYENIGCNNVTITYEQNIAFDTKTGIALIVILEGIILFTTLCQFVTLIIEYRNENNKILYEMID